MKEQIEKIDLIPKRDEGGDDYGEEEVKSSEMRVEDYTREEIEEDMGAIDWEFAYNEVLKVEEKKQDEAKLEQQRKMQEEKKRIEEELAKKYSLEKQKEIEVQNKKFEELRK